MRNRLTILIIICVLCIVWISFATADEISYNVIPEYKVALFDLSNPSVINARIFYAFSNDSDDWVEVSLEFTDTEKKSMVSSQVSDYFFFQARYLNQVENLFWNDEERHRQMEEAEERLELLRVFLFQQPFWLINLATRLPTALIEWNLTLKQRFTGLNRWPEVYGALDLKGLEHEQISALEISHQNDNPVFTFFVPPEGKRLTTHGLMISHHMVVDDQSRTEEIIESLLRHKIRAKDGLYYDDFPLTRILIVSDSSKNPLYVSTIAERDLSFPMLINRVGAKEPGWFSASEGILNDTIAAYRFGSWRMPPQNHVEFEISRVERIDDIFRKPVVVPSESDMLLRGLGIVLQGLVAWIILFLVFHMSILKRVGIRKLIGLSISCFVVYAVISTLFSFIYGFGFVLGIIGMESIVRKHTDDYPMIKLLGLGMMTAISVSLVAMLF